MAHILVTGANGFVGRHLCHALGAHGHAVVAVVRNTPAAVPDTIRTLCVGTIGAHTDWSTAVDGVDCVVHCAALAHQFGSDSGRAAEYMDVNAFATETLARACVRAGVGKFVLLSTVKVVCEETFAQPITIDSPMRPTGIYAQSKSRGEELLRQVAQSSSMRYCIVRSPLIYGPGVRANFLRLMSWIDRGIPLPLGGIANKRSLISVGNLCDLIEHLAHVRAASSEDIVLASDGADLSTPELIMMIAVAMRRRTRLISVPPALLSAVAALVGRADEVSRLCGSLTVDISDTRARLGWVPPIQVRDAIGQTVDWYLAHRFSGKT